MTRTPRFLIGLTVVVALTTLATIVLAVLFILHVTLRPWG